MLDNLEREAPKLSDERLKAAYRQRSEPAQVA